MGLKWNNPKAAENGKLGGRPVASSTLQAQLFRQALADYIAKDAQSWITAIEDSAKGHFVMQKTASGDVRVYKKSPDPQAWEKAIERAFGKMKAEVDVTSGGEPIVMPSEIILKNGISTTDK